MAAVVSLAALALAAWLSRRMLGATTVNADGRKEGFLVGLVAGVLLTLGMGMPLLALLRSP